jgi:hypothetical protein
MRMLTGMIIHRLLLLIVNNLLIHKIKHYSVIRQTINKQENKRIRKSIDTPSE